MFTEPTSTIEHQYRLPPYSCETQGVGGAGRGPSGAEVAQELLDLIYTDVRASLAATDPNALSTLWLLFMASRQVEDMKKCVGARELDYGHPIDFTHELQALLAGALHVPDATPAAAPALRQAAGRIPALMACFQSVGV